MKFAQPDTDITQDMLKMSQTTIFKTVQQAEMRETRNKEGRLFNQAAVRDINNALMKAQPKSQSDVSSLLKNPVALVAEYRSQHADTSYKLVHQGNLNELKTKATQDNSIARLLASQPFKAAFSYYDDSDTVKIIQTFPSGKSFALDGWYIIGEDRFDDLTLEVEKLACNGTRGGFCEAVVNKDGPLPLFFETPDCLHDGLDDGDGDVTFQIFGSWDPNGFGIYANEDIREWANKDVIAKLDAVLNQAGGPKPVQVTQIDTKAIESRNLAKSSNVASVVLASFIAKNASRSFATPEPAIRRFEQQATRLGVYNINNVLKAIIEQDTAQLDAKPDMKVGTSSDLRHQAKLAMYALETPIQSQQTGPDID